MNNAIKQLVCDSGLMGWESELRNNYDNSKAQFVANSETYGIAERLGFPSADAAWLFNPTIQGSTNPSDLRISSVMIQGETFTVHPTFNDEDESLEFYDVYGSDGFAINEGRPFFTAPTFAEILEIVDEKLSS